MDKQTCNLVGRPMRVEAHEHRLKVFDWLTDQEASRLGLNREAARGSRRDGFFWLRYETRQDNGREETAALDRIAAVGAARAWLWAERSLEGPVPVTLAELVAADAADLAQNSGRPELRDERSRIASARAAAVLLIGGRDDDSGPGGHTVSER